MSSKISLDTIAGGRFGEIIMEYRGVYITDRKQADTAWTLVVVGPQGPKIIDHCNEETLGQILDSIDVYRSDRDENNEYPIPRWRQWELLISPAV